VIEGLLIANQVRGTDSTGLAAIDYDGHYDIMKYAIEPWKFVNRDDTQSMLRTPSPIMMGHTRMTSMGNDITDNNAHPFVEGNVIGAHNGVINNYVQLDHTVRVDTQAVLRELDKNPEGYDFAFSKVSGSCALTWWDMREPDALFLVAHLNPLAAAIVPRIRTLFWSSVSDHLESAMRIAYGNDVDFVEIKQNTIYRVSADDVYAWQEGAVNFGSNATFRYSHTTGGFLGDDEDDWSSHYFGTKDDDPKAVSASEDDEERYEEYWDRLMASAAFAGKKNDAETLDREEGRFGIDDLDGSLSCGYCDDVLGDGGVWDAGLEILLCRRCQNWWDNFGYAKELEATLEKEPTKTYPLATV
jgi:hypothetical protein